MVGHYSILPMKFLWALNYAYIPQYRRESLVSELSFKYSSNIVRRAPAGWLDDGYLVCDFLSAELREQPRRLKMLKLYQLRYVVHNTSLK